MQFRNLLRNSRLATFQNSISKVNSSNVPHLQVLKTTPAAFHRKNWGLKTNLPAKTQSIYIDVEALDNEVGILPFKPASGPYRKIQRFRELGLNLQLPRTGEFENFFQLKKGKGQTWTSMKKDQMKDLCSKARRRRQAFLKYLQENNASVKDLHSSSSNNITKHVENFMGFKPSAAVKPLNRSGTAVSALGLSYNLKGSLHNTPSGLQLYKTVPGRVVSGRNNRNAAGLGGFVSKTTISHSMMRKQGSNSIREKNVENFIVQRAQATHNGVVELQSIASKLFGEPINNKVSGNQDDVINVFLEAEKQRTKSK